MFLDAATGRDAELLARFAATGDGAAFAELVRRHGPLARGVCERVLFDRAEADDAYQATLIVLARKAGQVRDPGRLGPWIYGVAVRCAMRARRSARLRRRRESPMREMPARTVDADWSDVRPLLDAEIAALPEKLRAAIVMCELQGVDRAEAARRLGVPEGTLSSRLARAKDALRVRLVRRGVALSAGGVAATLGRAQVSSAGVPAAGTPSAAAITLAELEVVMFPNLGILKVALGLLTAMGLTLAGIGLMPADKAKPDPVAAEKAKLKGDWIVIDARLDGQEQARGTGFRSLPGKTVTFGDDTLQLDIPTKYTIRPDESPKRIDITPTDESQVIPGIYELSGDKLSLRFAAPESRERPDGFAWRAGRPRGQWGLTLERKSPVTADKAKLKGEWRVKSVKRGGKDVNLDDPKNASEARPWYFRDNGLVRPDESISDVVTPFQLDPEASPKRIDFIPGNRSDAPYLAGIYKLDADKLTIATAATPTDYGKVAANRPAVLTSNTEPNASICVLERVTEAQALQRNELIGKWIVEKVTYDGDETRGSLFFEQPWLDFYWGQVNSASYTVDVSQTPNTIDLKRDVHLQNDNLGGGFGGPPVKLVHTIWNTPTPGIYKIEGDTLTWHFAAPDAEGKTTSRPTDFTPSKPGARHVLAVFKREKPPAKPDVAPTPAPPVKVTPPAATTAGDAFTGTVQVNGRDATSGRVAVYFGRGQFAGSLLVNGQFSIVGVPAGKHRVVVEGEVDGVRETTTASVEFNSAGVKRDFDLK